MSAILPTLKIDSEPSLARHFTPYQVHWILAEDPLHAQGKQVYALAEKSIRIGWTFCDGFKNVRKRLLFKKRDYLFATKDLPSALEYMNQVYTFASLFDLTGSILSHGEEYLKLPRLDDDGHPTSFTEEIKVGVIKFDTGSRIIAFSSNPQAMAVYGGDVGLDEFAKHPNARLLWEVAQGRITWNGDIAVWSSHDGEDMPTIPPRSSPWSFTTPRKRKWTPEITPSTIGTAHPAPIRSSLWLVVSVPIARVTSTRHLNSVKNAASTFPKTELTTPSLHLANSLTH